MTAGLGIDVGLSGVRAAVVDERGALLGSGRAGGRPRLTADRAEADPREWLLGALEAGAAAVVEAGVEVDAIGVSALGPAPVLVTREGEAVSPALLFGLDRRAEEQRARLGVTHDHALPKLLWWAEHEPGRVARSAMAVDATAACHACAAARAGMAIPGSTRDAISSRCSTTRAAGRNMAPV